MSWLTLALLARASGIALAISLALLGVGDDIGQNVLLACWPSMMVGEENPVAIGQHYQNAYVTRNVDKAVASFREHADTRLIIETEVEVPLWTPQGEGMGVQKLAFVWIDDLNYELIEPKDGAALAIYRDALPADDSLQFHHVCHRVDDWDELQAHIAANPFPVVLKGGTPGVLQFCYVDTRPWLGHYTEYLCCNAERWGQLGGR